MNISKYRYVAFFFVAAKLPCLFIETVNLRSEKKHLHLEATSVFGIDCDIYAVCCFSVWILREDISSLL